ncbi:MAG: hypothetical protein RBR39_07950 [Proteiniphilum sp.]|nr:hypothetical protein [Proteiniphilum sp.]
MTEIEERLAKLKKLDPDAWDAWMSLYCAWEGVEYAFGAELGQSDLYLLQGVIQDAIAADDRFLFFEVRFTSYFDVKYEATIFWDGTGSISQDGYGETAAEAILATYIAALEAGR